MSFFISAAANVKLELPWSYTIDSVGVEAKVGLIKQNIQAKIQRCTEKKSLKDLDKEKINLCFMAFSFLKLVLLFFDLVTHI